MDRFSDNVLIFFWIFVVLVKVMASAIKSDSGSGGPVRDSSSASSEPAKNKIQMARNDEVSVTVAVKDQDHFSALKNEVFLACRPDFLCQSLVVYPESRDDTRGVYRGVSLRSA